MPSAVPSFRFTCVRRMPPNRRCDDGRNAALARSAGRRRARMPPLFGNKRAQAREHEVEPVVLRRYLHAARQQVHDGLVAAVMSEFQLFHARARRLADHLVTQADAEHRHFSEQLLHLLVRARHRVRVARAVREEHAVGCHREHLFGRRVPRNDRHLAPSAHQPFENRALHAAVVGDDAIARRRGGRKRERLACGKRRLRRNAYGSAHDTVFARFTPTIGSLARAFATRLAAFRSSVDSAARMAP